MLGEENELPYRDGLKTCIEWESWCAEHADTIVERAESAEDDAKAAALWGQAFKFARQAHTEASIRERQYLTQKHQKEIAALRNSNDKVAAIVATVVRPKNGPAREDGN